MVLCKRLKMRGENNMDAELRDGEFKKYSDSEFRQAIAFANRYKSLEGVEELILELETMKEKYEADYNKIVEAEEPALELLYQEYMRNFQREERLKKILIIIFIVMIISFCIKFKLLLQCGVLLLLVSGITMIFVKKSGKKHYDNHGSRFEKVLEKLEPLHGKKECSVICKKIDTIYLESLDPMERELIVTRRESEKQLIEIKNIIYQWKLENEHHLKELGNVIKELQKELQESIKIGRENFEMNDKLQKELKENIKLNNKIL